MRRRMRCVNGMNSPFETGKVYTLQKETPDAYYFDGVKGAWEKTRFIEVGCD